MGKMNGWQPIETIPKDGPRVLGWLPDGEDWNYREVKGAVSIHFVQPPFSWHYPMFSSTGFYTDENRWIGPSAEKSLKWWKSMPEGPRVVERRGNGDEKV